jgi:hypothetical protein
MPFESGDFDNKEMEGGEPVSPEVAIEEMLKKGFLESASETAKDGGVSEEKMKEIVMKYVLDNFKDKNHKDILHILQYFNVGEDFLNDETFVELAKDRVVMKLAQGDISVAYEVLKDLNIDEEFLGTAEAVKGAENGIQAVLANDEIGKALEIQKTFNIDNDFMEGAAKAEIKMRLIKELVNSAFSLQEKFNIPQSFMEEAVKDEVLSRLSSGNSLTNIANFIDRLKMDVSFLSDKKVKEALKARINLPENNGQELVPSTLKDLIVEEESKITEEGA